MFGFKLGFLDMPSKFAICVSAEAASATKGKGKAKGKAKGNAKGKAKGKAKSPATPASGKKSAAK